MEFKFLNQEKKKMLNLLSHRFCTIIIVILYVFSRIIRLGYFVYKLSISFKVNEEKKEQSFLLLLERENKNC